MNRKNESNSKRMMLAASHIFFEMIHDPDSSIDDKRRRVMRVFACFVCQISLSLICMFLINVIRIR